MRDTVFGASRMTERGRFLAVKIVHLVINIKSLACETLKYGGYPSLSGLRRQVVTPVS
jgi:hypothetical protein